MENNKAHWENVFATKQETDVSWYQKNPKTSLEFITNLKIPKTAKIIDIGGGDSYFIDALLELGFANLTLLDISSEAIERIKKRLGAKAKHVTFITSDVLDFLPLEAYDYWNDRACFHFLTNKKEINQYVKLASNSVSQNGKMVIGTFSENGPKKCSGLEICQYNPEKLKTIFDDNFEPIESFTQDHKTPFDTIQNFVFCSFKKL